MHKSHLFFSIETAAKEANVDQNMEVEELAVPIIKGNTGGQVDNLTQSRY